MVHKTADEARMSIFSRSCGINVNLADIPCTSNALHLHASRASVRTYIWKKAKYSANTIFFTGVTSINDCAVSILQISRQTATCSKRHLTSRTSTTPETRSRPIPTEQNTHTYTHSHPRGLAVSPAGVAPSAQAADRSPRLSSRREAGARLSFRDPPPDVIIRSSSCSSRACCVQDQCYIYIYIFPRACSPRQHISQCARLLIHPQVHVTPQPRGGGGGVGV